MDHFQNRDGAGAEGQRPGDARRKAGLQTPPPLLWSPSKFMTLVQVDEPSYGLVQFGRVNTRWSSDSFRQQRDWQPFSIKGQIVNIFSFADERSPWLQ